MLDTSAVILLGEISDPTELPDESMISAITLAELSVGPHVAHDDAERSARQQHLQQAEADFEVLPFDDDCARAFGGVAAEAPSRMRCRCTHAIQLISRGSRGWNSGRSLTRITNSAERHS